MKHLLFLLLFTISLSAQTVYKTPSGEKYHTNDCRMVKNKAAAMSLTDAADLGLSPCKICRPSTSSVLRATSKTTSTAGQKTSTTQCKGSTKAGNRCKHMTKIGNGYCFQHQP